MSAHENGIAVTPETVDPEVTAKAIAPCFDSFAQKALGCDRFAVSRKSIVCPVESIARQRYLPWLFTLMYVSSIR